MDVYIDPKGETTYVELEPGLRVPMEKLTVIVDGKEARSGDGLNMEDIENAGSVGFLHEGKFYDAAKANGDVLDVIYDLVDPM